MAAASRAWKWAIARELIFNRPFPDPQVRIDTDSFAINHRTPSPDEVCEVIGALTGEHALLVRLLTATGARITEACTVTAADLDLRTGMLELDGKTGRRRFPLAKSGDRALYAELALRARGRLPAAPLFDLGATPAESVRSALTRACRRAGVERFTPHGIRRMVVTQMVRGGVDVKHAAAITGHSVEVMLRTYAQITEESLGEAVEAAGLGIATEPVKEVE